MNPAILRRYGIFAILALAMLLTRINHFAPLPDASWAIFFVAGFYLRDAVRWAFPALMVEAVLIDYIVISGQGISFWQHYCVSAAYWFLVLSYLVLWFGGAWLRAHYRGLHLRELGLLALTFVAAVSACYLVSNGSFYWLSDSVPQPRSMSAWSENLGDWYLPYLRTAAAYTAFAALVHAIVAQLTHKDVVVQPQKARR